MANTYINLPGNGSNEKIIATYWTSVGASSGTIALPTGGTLVQDAFQDLEEAVVSHITIGKPDFNAAVDALGSRCVATLDGFGAYTISPDPVAFPVALLFRVTIPLSNYDPVTQQVVEEDVERVGSGGGDVTSVNSATGAVTVAGTNVGTGARVYKDNSNPNLRFRTLVGSGVTVTEDTNTITITGNSYNPGGW